jgi:leader peptidase (prepilin peptidase)/N-methyltransferase
VSQSVIVFLLGACIGSFLNVCISRWPDDLSVIRPRSRCPRCQQPIAWYDNIPILSWVLLRAKCRGCGLPISAQYPLVEGTVGALWLASWIAFGPTLTALRLAIVSTILLGIAVTDLKHYVIPDGFTVSGFLFAMLSPVAAFALDEHGPFAGPWDAVIGACVGAGIITIVGWLGEVALKKEAMGEGDATLMAFVGAIVGPGRALLTVFVAAGLASAVFLFLVMPVGAVRARARGEPFVLPLVPFGVFLAPAGVVTLLWGYPLLDWYVGTLTR